MSLPFNANDLLNGEPIEVRIERGERFVISYPGPFRSLRLVQLHAGRANPRLGALSMENTTGLNK